MADPITAIQVISAATSLAAQCAQVIKGLHDLAGKLKNAKLSIRSTAHELDIIRLAWERIESALRSWEGDEESDENLLQRLRLNLDFGRLIVSSLAEDMHSFTKRPLTFARRSKYVWSEEKFKGHQDRIRGQAGAMTLLVSVLKLPSALERATLLQEGAETLRKSDESAYTIVPSRLSSGLPSIYSNASDLSVESAELVYRRLSIDDALFTARVYKRNYRHRFMNIQERVRPSVSLRKNTNHPYEALDAGVFDGQARRVSTDGRSVALSNYEADKPSSSPNDDPKLLLQSCSNIQIPSCRWFQETRVLDRNKVDGPAVSLDLLYLENDLKRNRSLSESVSQCQPRHLEHLLRVLQGGKHDWTVCYLLEACGQRRGDLVDVLIENDVDFAKWLLPDSRYDIEDYLKLAYNVSSTKLLRLLCSTIPKDLLSVHPTPQHLLEQACLEGQTELAECFLGHELPPQNSLLLIAVRNSDYDLLKLLLYNGYNVNARFDSSTSLIHHVVRMLTENWCLCEAGLYYPVGLRLFRLLVDLGVDLDAVDCNGDNILHYAARKPAVFIVLRRFLVATGAHVSFALTAKNNNGDTPGGITQTASPLEGSNPCCPSCGDKAPLTEGMRKRYFKLRAAQRMKIQLASEIDHVNAGLKFSNAEIEWYILESTSEWRYLGSARLTITGVHPSSSLGELRQSGYSSLHSRRVVITGTGTRKEDILLAAQLDRRCIERTSMYTIDLTVWENVTDPDKNMEIVSMAEEMDARTPRHYALQLNSEAETAKAFEILLS